MSGNGMSKAPSKMKNKHQKIITKCYCIVNTSNIILFGVLSHLIIGKNLWGYFQGGLWNNNFVELLFAISILLSALALPTIIVFHLFIRQYSPPKPYLTSVVSVIPFFTYTWFFYQATQSLAW